MDERRFTNDYDINAYALSLLIRRFPKEDNIFAAQCIWWLASIIQYMEILRYYLKYQTFPSEYLRDCTVTPLSEQVNDGTIIPERLSGEVIVPDSDISELQLDSETEFWSESVSEAIAETQGVLPINRRMRSGRVVKPGVFPNKKRRQRYPGRIEKQLKALWFSIKKDGLIHEEIKGRVELTSTIEAVKDKELGRLCLDIILPIVSEHQIYEGLRREFCEDTCQFRLHYQWAKYCRWILINHLDWLFNTPSNKY